MVIKWVSYMNYSMSLNKQYFIQKAEQNRADNRRTAYKIQFYNNMLVDEFVENYEDNEYVKPSTSMLWADLDILTKPQVFANYQRLLNSQYVNNNALQQILIKNKAQKDANRIIEAEIERINKNLDYVEQVMRKYEVPVQAYQDKLKKQQNSSIANRRQVLDEVTRQANEISTKTGLNIPKPYSYRNLDTVAENLLREQKVRSQHESIILENELSKKNGDGLKYTKKTWVWTGRGKTTRHRSNDGQIRDIDEKFIVMNDKTGDIDLLDYPMDVKGSFSNCSICYCEVKYS